MDAVMTRALAQQSLLLADTEYALHQSLDRVEKRLASAERQFELVGRIHGQVFAAHERKWRAKMAVVSTEARELHEERTERMRRLRAMAAPGEPLDDEVDVAVASFFEAVALVAEHGASREARLLEARVPEAVVALVEGAAGRNVATGTGLHALVNLCRLPRVRHRVTELGAVPLALRAVSDAHPEAVQQQACFLLASLSYESSGRFRLARAGAGHLVRLAKATTNEHVMEAAQCALTNCCLDNVANQTLIVQEGALPPTVECMFKMQWSRVLTQCCRTLANLAFINEYAATRIVEADGDQALVSVLECSDVLHDHNLVQAAVVALGNLANCERIQSHVGAQGVPEALVQVIRHSPSETVLLAAVRAVAAVAFQSDVNKLRLGECGALAALGALAVRAGYGEELVLGTARALTTLLLHHVNERLASRSTLLDSFVARAVATTSPVELESFAKVLCAAVPNHTRISALAREGRLPAVCRTGAFQALHRARNWLFGTNSPAWLDDAIARMASAIALNDEAEGEPLAAPRGTVRVVESDSDSDSGGGGSGAGGGRSEDDVRLRAELFPRHILFIQFQTEINRQVLTEKLPSISK